MATQTIENHSRHGSAELEQQIRTYHSFMVGLRYIMLALIVSITFLILAYGSDAGWGVGLFVAVVELGVGLYFAMDREKIGWSSVFGGLFISTAAESGESIEDRMRAKAVEYDASEHSGG